MSDQDVFNEIARIAYELWEKNGCTHGRDIEYWCEAESIVVFSTQPNAEEEPEKAKTPKKTASKAATGRPKTATKARKPKGPAKKKT